MKLLLTTVAGLCLLLGVHAQGPQIAFCNTYQTTQAFDQAFISKMQATEGGFSFLLTSGANYGCKKLTFFPNGTYFYDYVSERNIHQNASGTYRMKPFSFSSPAAIEMSSLPYGELGSVLGAISFNVLQAEEDLLVLFSCVNIGIIRSQQLHILVPEAKSSSISVMEVNATMQERQVPLAEYLQEVQQVCAPGLRQIPGLGLIRRLIRKLGINVPWYFSQNDAAMDPLLFAALANPNIQTLDSNALVPQSFRQEPGVFQSQVSPPSSLAPSFAYPQAAPVSLLQQPHFSGQYAGPLVPAGVQLGFQQFQRPLQVYTRIPTPTNSFGGQSSQFFITSSDSSLNYFKPEDRPNSIPFFLANQPSQSTHVGEQQSGLYSVFYQG